MHKTARHQETILATVLFILAFVVTAWSSLDAHASQKSADKPYHSIISKHANKHGVPVDMAHAFVRVESNYDFRVRGRRGEVGLMQLHPVTARGIGYKGTMKALYTPETNITWGMKYLAMAYRKAGGDLCRTVMFYQSGLYAKRFSKWNRLYCTKVRQYMAGANPV